MVVDYGHRHFSVGLFIRHQPNYRDDRVFVKAMADVAPGLRILLTIANYIEDVATLEMIRSYGVGGLKGITETDPWPIISH